MDGSPKAQLSVYARRGAPKLVYDITVQGTRNNGTPSSMHYIIDAHQLALVERDTVHTTDAVGTGKSLTWAPSPCTPTSRPATTPCVT